VTAGAHKGEKSNGEFFFEKVKMRKEIKNKNNKK
jgi:hypothetical protein